MEPVPFWVTPTQEAAVSAAVRKDEAPMGKIRLEEWQGQATSARPQPGTAVYLAVDLSRTKWVYCARWGGAEQRRLSTPAGLQHVPVVGHQYTAHELHVAYEACGLG